jgi:hypothetical protein
MAKVLVQCNIHPGPYIRISAHVMDQHVKVAESEITDIKKMFFKKILSFLLNALIKNE